MRKDHLITPILGLLIIRNLTLDVVCLFTKFDDSSSTVLSSRDKKKNPKRNNMLISSGRVTRCHSSAMSPFDKSLMVSLLVNLSDPTTRNYHIRCVSIAPFSRHSELFVEIFAIFTGHVYLMPR